MNDECDPLEAELAALQPRTASADLEQRIAAQLERDSRWPVRHRVWMIGVAAGAVAASLVAVLWLWRGGEVAKVDPPIAQPVLPLAIAFDPALPSVWSYRKAARQSADELNALLDQHAGRQPTPPTQYVQIRGFGVSELERSLGEL